MRGSPYEILHEDVPTLGQAIEEAYEYYLEAVKLMISPWRVVRPHHVILIPATAEVREWALRRAHFQAII